MIFAHLEVDGNVKHGCHNIQWTIFYSKGEDFLQGFISSVCHPDRDDAYKWRMVKFVNRKIDPIIPKMSFVKDMSTIISLYIF